MSLVPFNVELLSVLVCPVTKQELIYDEERQELISSSAGLAYPIKEGIPVMLPEEARQCRESSSAG